MKYFLSLIQVKPPPPPLIIVSYMLISNIINQKLCRKKFKIKTILGKAIYDVKLQRHKQLYKRTFTLKTSKGPGYAVPLPQAVLPLLPYLGSTETQSLSGRQFYKENIASQEDIVYIKETQCILDRHSVLYYEYKFFNRTPLILENIVYQGSQCILG